MPLGEGLGTRGAWGAWCERLVSGVWCLVSGVWCSRHVTASWYTVI